MYWMTWVQLLSEWLWVLLSLLFNRYSVSTVTGYVLDDLGSIPVRVALGSAQSSIQQVPGALFSGLR